MTASAAKKGKVVSARVPKNRPVLMDPNDPMFKMIAGFFDETLKKEFSDFLLAKSAKVVDIASAPSKKKAVGKGKGKKKGAYKQEGSEPISFKEIALFNNPAFSLASKFSPAQYNPETIDVDTFTLMRRDPQLGMGLAVIKLPLQSLPWTIICGDEKIKKTVEWALKKIWKKLIKTSLMAVDYGFSVHEKVWERDTVKVSETDTTGKETVYHNGDLAFYKKIKPMHPESISMKFDGKQNLEEIWQDGELGQQEDIKLPIRKCFIFTHNEEWGNPFGVSRLKNAYKVWYWKELLYQFMMQYFERRGTPPTIGTAPPGRSSDANGTEYENMDLMSRMATSLISSSVAVIPYQKDKDSKENMWSLEILKDDARGPMFVEALAHMDMMCLRAILVPESVVGTSGGFAQSTVHADIFLMAEKAVLTDLEDAVNNQLIDPFVRVNFAPQEYKPAYMKLDPLDWNRKTALKELFMEMLRNIDTMVQMGFPPTMMPSFEKMAEILEIPVASWEEVTGFSVEETMKIIKEQKETGFGNQNDQDSGGDKSPKAKGKEKDTKGSSGKIGGRKSTRKRNVPQATERRRVSPGGRRADRNRDNKK